MNECLVSTPLGDLLLQENGQGLEKAWFVENYQTRFSDSQFLKEAAQQFVEYFHGKRTRFDIALHPIGTDFQIKVWNELLKIPYGTTISYSELANRLGNPKTIRAAASANGKNPLGIIIPCHRVIGSSGDLVGYAGGLPRKKWLLRHEGFDKQETLIF
ncbi:MAG: methylated-DNA--[protein]-cysteine S-methyltransferase [Bacteroidia bacterium]|nr:methylated-DNA--[protein]-cysteine S-methyltransferase [Bacteroidia bacterium]